MALMDALADLLQGGFQGYKFGHDIDENVRERKRRIQADADDRFRYENESRYRDEQNRIQGERTLSAERRAAAALDATQIRDDARYREMQDRDDRRFEQTTSRDAVLNRYNLGRDAANDRRDNSASAANTALALALKQETLDRARRAEKDDYVGRAIEGYGALHGNAPDVQTVVGGVNADPRRLDRAKQLGLSFADDWLPGWAKHQAQLAKDAPRVSGDAALMAALQGGGAPLAPPPTAFRAPAPPSIAAPAPSNTAAISARAREIKQANPQITSGELAAQLRAEFSRPE